MNKKISELPKVQKERERERGEKKSAIMKVIKHRASKK